MDKILIQPAYFAPTIQYAAIAQAKAVVFEVHDNYQKQSYRNRFKIATATGSLALTIPILHRVDKTARHQTTNEVRLENQFKWQRNHWRSLKTAYQTSPYFEYYEDDLAPLYHQEWDKLSAFHDRCHAFVMDCLQIEIPTSNSIEYFRNPSEQKDLRFLIDSKSKRDYALPEYNQLFGENHGYLKNMSILDLLFNQGPNAITYLEQVDLTVL